MNYTLVIHGGAGTIRAADTTPVQQEAYRAALLAALAAGEAVLSLSGLALDAVEATVRCLEDCPLFNAGRGSTFTAAGTIEMDAAVMDGATGATGAVASVSRIRNPITAARAVAARTLHVLLVGEGADAFAEKEGLELASELENLSASRMRIPFGSTAGYRAGHG